MFVNFNHVFNKRDTNKGIPVPIMKALSNELPPGLKYVPIDSEACAIVPEGKKLKFSFNLANDEDLKGIAVEDLNEFLYRSQKKLEISSNTIKINGYDIEISELVKLPLSDDEIVKGSEKLVIIPEPFPKPFDIELKFNDGEEFSLKIQRQPLADLKKSLFTSVGLAAFELSYVIDEEKNYLDMKFDLKLGKANDIQEIITASKLAYKIMNGEVSIGDMTLKVNSNYNFNKSNLNELIDFWEKVKKISSFLHLSFNPKIDISKGDVKVVNVLYDSFILNQNVKEFIPQSELELVFDENLEYDELLQHSPLSFKFKMKEDFNLLGENISLISITELSNFKIDKIIKDKKEDFTYLFKLSPTDEHGILREMRYYLEENDIHSINDLNTISEH